MEGVCSSVVTVLPILGLAQLSSPISGDALPLSRLLCDRVGGNRAGGLFKSSFGLSGNAPTTSSTPSNHSGSDAPAKSPPGSTVVLDVEEGGIEVPSFLGKNVRNALEAAQDAGLDLDAIGSGTAREQSPQPGAHVAAGARVTVRFGR